MHPDSRDRSHTPADQQPYDSFPMLQELRRYLPVFPTPPIGINVVYNPISLTNNTHNHYYGASDGKTNENAKAEGSNYNVSPDHQPREYCRNLPDCKFGQQCKYYHPPCKFADKCQDSNCPYTHPHIVVPPITAEAPAAPAYEVPSVMPPKPYTVPHFWIYDEPV